MTTAYGTLAYGVAIGLMAMAAIVFVAIGVRRSYGASEPFMLAFAFLSAIGAVSAWNVVELHTSTSVEDYAATFSSFGLFSLIAIVALVVVVATLTGTVPRWALVLFGVATVIVGVLQLALPVGLLADQIDSLRQVRLFGETFVVHVAGRSPWRPVLDGYLVLLAVLVGVALARHARRGRGTESMVISIALLLTVGVSAYDSLVDDGWVDTPYLAPFGGMFVAVAGAVMVAVRIVRAERRVAENAVRLEQTVVERTSALISANDELNRQLARQRTTMSRLETLSTEFERSNQEVGPGLDGAASAERIASVLETLGVALDLRCVTLRLDGADLPDKLPSIIEWTLPGDGGAVAHAPRDPVSEAVLMEGQVLGSLEIEPRDRNRVGDEEVRYARLTAKHLAGFVHRMELDRLVAANAVDIERHRIGRDLHDSVTQRLYSMAFLAEAARRQVIDDPATAADTIERIRSLLHVSLSELRVLLFELQPQSLDATRLRQLLEQLVETVVVGPDATVHTDLDDVPVLPRRVKLGMYRMAQESLSNAVRHSRAESITMRLHCDGDETVLAVTDTGVGFDVDGVQRGHGLRNIETRASEVGARYSVESSIGVGTDVVVTWRPGEATS